MNKMLLTLLILNSLLLAAQEKKDPGFSGNPLFPGWYADPEGTIFGDTYWIYPTFSDESGVKEPGKQFYRIPAQNTPKHHQSPIFEANLPRRFLL